MECAKSRPFWDECFFRYVVDRDLSSLKIVFTKTRRAGGLNSCAAGHDCCLKNIGEGGRAGALESC